MADSLSDPTECPGSLSARHAPDSGLASLPDRPRWNNLVRPARPVATDASDNDSEPRPDQVET